MNNSGMLAWMYELVKKQNELNRRRKENAKKDETTEVIDRADQ